MIIIDLCPKCGHELHETVICTYPSIDRKECCRCGWSWESEPVPIVKVPFNDGSACCNTDYVIHGNTDYECLNSTDCFANNLAGTIFTSNMITQENTIKLCHDDIMAAVDRIEKYIKK